MVNRRAFNQSERAALFIHANGKCQKCGNDLGDDWEADHVHPFARGGDTDLLNGQALCQKCNREKGASVVFDKPNAIFRTWQKEQQASFEQHDSKWFTLVATPGAGKTLAMLMNAYYMLRSGKADFLVIVTPSETLKYQWKDKARTIFGLSIQSEFAGFATKDFDGVAITYQYLKTGVQQLQALHNYRGKVFVIFDEPHHMADNNVWGVEAQRAFNRCIGGVLGTGTPFRSDDYMIPFVEYSPEKPYSLRPNYEYLYADGLIDQVVRAIFFRKIDTKASWYSYTDEIMTDVSFYDELPERQMQERLNATIDANSDFVKHVLEQAYAETANLRRTEQANAKGLIICKDKRHADNVADVFERVNGVRPIIVSSDEEHGNKHDIEAFKKSDDMFIISVDMISEGVDIPPLRTLVYLTNKTAALYFYQAIGRVVRVERGFELSNGYVYLPSDPRLLKLAHEIKERRNHVIEYLRETTIDDTQDDKKPDETTIDDTQDDKKPDETPIWTPPAPRRFFEVINAHAVDDGGIYDSEGYTPDELAAARAFIRENGLRIQVEECARILRIMSKEAPKSSINGIQPPPDVEVILKDLRDTANRLAYRLSKILDCEAKTIHSEWVFNHGGSWQKQATIEDLKRKIKWLSSRLGGTPNVAG